MEIKIVRNYLTILLLGSDLFRPFKILKTAIFRYNRCARVNILQN